MFGSGCLAVILEEAADRIDRGFGVATLGADGDPVALPDRQQHQLDRTARARRVRAPANFHCRVERLGELHQLRGRSRMQAFAHPDGDVALHEQCHANDPRWAAKSMFRLLAASPHSGSDRDEVTGMK